MGADLHRRCFDHLLPEPLVFYQDDDGTPHFASTNRPLRTIIDVQNLPWATWVRYDELARTVTVQVDGETLVYRKVGADIHGAWVCERIAGDADVQRSNNREAPSGPGA